MMIYPGEEGRVKNHANKVISLEDKENTMDTV